MEIPNDYQPLNFDSNVLTENLIRNATFHIARAPFTILCLRLRCELALFTIRDSNFNCFLNEKSRCGHFTLGFVLTAYLASFSKILMGNAIFVPQNENKNRKLSNRIPFSAANIVWNFAVCRDRNSFACDSIMNHGLESKQIAYFWRWSNGRSGPTGARHSSQSHLVQRLQFCLLNKRNSFIFFSRFISFARLNIQI